MSFSTDFQTARAERLRVLGLKLEDFEESFHRSGGPGGQNVNKVSTAACVRHVPTGVQVTAQDTRSQAKNRQLAWMRVLDAIEKERTTATAAVKDAAEKERRRKRKRPYGLQQRILKDKKKRSETKKMRSRSW